MLLYCSAYYVVSNRFFKKGCELFSSFLPPRISFHTMCVSSLLNFDPTVLPCPSIQSQIHFWTTWTNRHFHPPAISHTPLNGGNRTTTINMYSFFLFCFGVFFFCKRNTKTLHWEAGCSWVAFPVDLSTPCECNVEFLKSPYQLSIAVFFATTILKTIWTIWMNSKRNDFQARHLFFFPRGAIILAINTIGTVQYPIYPHFFKNSVPMGTNLIQMSPWLMSCRDNNYAELQLLLTTLKASLWMGNYERVSHKHTVSCFSPRAPVIEGLWKSIPVSYWCVLCYKAEQSHGRWILLPSMFHVAW